jgi:hypothetical protein
MHSISAAHPAILVIADWELQRSKQKLQHL